MIRIIASFTTAFVCLLVSLPLMAQSLGSCSGSCGCTTTEIDDYGNCTIITQSNMMDTMDPGEVASLTNLTATHNSSTGEVTVSANIGEPAGIVIPVNTYNGDWPDLATLQGYLDDLYEGDVPTGSLPDLCTTFLPYDSYSQAGAIARWNPTTGDWAADQTQNVVLAAITAADGSLSIDGVQVIDPPVLAEGCLTDTDGPLAGETCSRVGTITATFPEFCSSEKEQSITLDIAIAEERDIKWNGFNTEVEYSGSLSGGNLRFEIKRVVAETIEATGRWYDGGSYVDVDSVSFTQDDYARVEEAGPDGVCTFPGRAEREKQTPLGNIPYEVEGETREGSAPTTCSTN